MAKHEESIRSIAMASNLPFSGFLGLKVESFDAILPQFHDQKSFLPGCSFGLHPTVRHN